jgi:hypothetical protein
MTDTRETAYVWVMTYDHLDHVPMDVAGPHDADDTAIERIRNGEGATYKIYDDDGELYMTGRLLVDAPDVKDWIEFADAPLRDFAGPSWGATLIKFPGRPTWTCEY